MGAAISIVKNVYLNKGGFFYNVTTLATLEKYLFVNIIIRHLQSAVLIPPDPNHGCSLPLPFSALAVTDIAKKYDLMTV